MYQEYRVRSFGYLMLFFKTYSMGAGTYTGIDTIGNGMPLLEEPRVVTGGNTGRRRGAGFENF